MLFSPKKNVLAYSNDNQIMYYVSSVAYRKLINRLLRRQNSNFEGKHLSQKNKSPNVETLFNP